MSDVRWFYGRGGQQSGPVSEAELKQMAASGQLTGEDMVWREGMAQWQSAMTIPELFPAGVPKAPPPLPPGAGGLQPGQYPGQPPMVGYYAPGPPAPGSNIGEDPGMRWLLPVGRSGWAIAAGYLGLFSFVVFPAPISLIVSIIAIRDIKKHPNRHGMGRAIFGLVAGLGGTIVLCMMLPHLFSRGRF